jgi:DNA recombination protein RmuC
METSLIILLAALAAVVLFVALRNSRGARDATNQSDRIASMLQAQVEALRTQVSDSLARTSAQLTTQMQNNVNTVNQQLGDFRRQFYATTETINQHLGSVTKQVQEATGQVGQRLDSAAKVIGDVKENLGQLGRATQEIKEVGQSVAKLDEILRAPKLRGGLGEMMLEDLLKQVIPPAHYQMQYRFKSRETVDAIIKTTGGIIPIDAKFPLENFRRMMAATSDAERQTLAKAFIKDVKARIDEISRKYILPDEGTMNFALMYVPAENVYYEAMIRDENPGEAGSIYAYAIERRVVPVSPNNFYAYLQVIALGLKGLQIEKSAQEIHQALGRLQGDLGKFSEVFAKVGTQLGYARSNYEEADRQLANFKDKLQNVAGREEAERLPLQPGALPNVK